MKADTSKLHLEILDEKRQNLLQKLLPFAESYVLGGGTALSLQMTHRLSFDFDFFSQKEIPKNLLEKLFRVIEISEVLVNSEDELTFLVAEGIKCTFLYYPFPNCFEILEYQNNLNLFSKEEIAIKKAYTIGRRGVYRDYFDLYTLLKKECISLEQIISKAEIVYKQLFNPKLFLAQLVYFADLPDYEIIALKGKDLPLPKEVKDYLEKTVKKYTETKK